MIQFIKFNKQLEISQSTVTIILSTAYGLEFEMKTMKNVFFGFGLIILDFNNIINGRNWSK